MYQPSTPPSTPLHVGRTALIYGLGAGIALGLVECAIDIYTTHTMDHAFSKLGGPFNLLLWITVLLVVGALAGKRVGKTSAGALVGLWTGMSSSIILAISGFFILLSFSVDYFSASTDYFNVNGLVALYLSALIIFVVVMISIGTGLGALGALIGQSFFTPAPAFAPAHQYQQSDSPRARETNED